MKKRKQVIQFCKTLPEVYEDYPFDDPNWTVIRHNKNKKIFAWIFERESKIWVNLKCNPEWTEFWRNAFQAVVPAFHLNKKHWNSIILDGSIPPDQIKMMIQESYDLTKPSVRKQKSDE